MVTKRLEQLIDQQNWQRDARLTPAHDEPENEFGRPRSHGIGSYRASKGCICRWCDPERWGPDFHDGRHWDYWLKLCEESVEDAISQKN